MHRMTRLIIAGSRTLHPEAAHISFALRQQGWAQIDEVVSGGAQGVDSAGEAWAHATGVPVKIFRPDWCAFGRAAGPMRNRHMAQYATHALVFWDGASPGTANLMAEMRQLDKPIAVHQQKIK